MSIYTLYTIKVGTLYTIKVGTLYTIKGFCGLGLTVLQIWAQNGFFGYTSLPYGQKKERHPGRSSRHSAECQP